MTVEPAPNATAKSIITTGQYQTFVSSGKHAVVADEPEDKDGTDTGMTPTELLLASLSACTAITLQMYIKRKMWVVKQIVVDLELFNTDTGTLIHRKIDISGELTDDQRKRILHVAEACPVHKMLTGQVVVETALT